MSEAPDILDVELSGEHLRLTKLSRSLEIFGYLYECFVTAQGKTDSDVVAVISSTTTDNPIKSTILGDQLRAAANQYKEIKALEQSLLNQMTAFRNSRRSVAGS